MPLEDLDLEFEDEEEAKRKKPEAVQVDVDLEFASPAGGKPRPKAPPASEGKTPPPQNIPAQVKNIDDARNRPRPAGAAPPQAQPRPQGTSPAIVGTAALKESAQPQSESETITALRAEMKRIQFEADVKVAIAEFKLQFLSELNGDMKLMEHQIGQLLSRLATKYPDAKQDLLSVKKILADFTSKKRQ